MSWRPHVHWYRKVNSYPEYREDANGLRSASSVMIHIKRCRCLRSKTIRLWAM